MKALTPSKPKAGHAAMRVTSTQRKAAVSAVAASETMPEPRAAPIRLLFPKDRYAFILALLISVILFGNGFSSELVFDDLLAIMNNKDAATDQGVPLRDIFFHDFWGHKLDEVASNGSYRPLTILTFRLQYLLAGRAHRGAFLHLFNFIFAYANACLVFYVARLYHQLIQPRERRSHAATATTGSNGASPCVSDASRGGWITKEPYAVPALAMLLFLAHPVHVDAVTSIVGRCEVLYCFFGLLAFFTVHAYATHPTPTAALGTGGSRERRRHAGRGKVSAVLARLTAAPRDKPVLLLGFMAGLMVCCLLCKDSGVTFTALFMVHTALLYAWGFTNARRLAVVVVASVAVIAAYFSLRRQFIGVVDLSKSRLIRRTENPQYFIPDGAWHWLSMRWTVQVKNLELLFYPTKLCCEYSYNCIPHMESLHDSRLPYYVAVSSLLLVFLATLGYRGFARGSRLAVVLLVFILWIAIPYLPVSHLLVHVGTFIAERCLYVPSIGVVLIYAFLLQPAIPRAVRATGVVGGGGARGVALLALVCVWLLVSHERNRAWRSNEELFREAIKVCPNSGKSHAQLAIAVTRREGRLTPEAVALFQRALELDEEDREPLFYLALDQWQNKRNAAAAYEMIRECVSSPFSVSRCYPMLMEMRSALFPNMSRVDMLLDDALISPLLSQSALRYREAGLLQRATDPKDPCAGLKSMQKALHRWNESELYWSSTEAHPEYNEKSFCNTGYWFAEIFDNCHLQPGVPDEEKEVERLDADGEREPVVKPRSLRRAMRDIRMVAGSCATDWHAPGVVRGATKKLLLTYGNRLREIHALAARLRLTLAHMKPFLVTDELKRLAKVTALQVVMSQYCTTVSLVENPDVKLAMAEHFRGEVAEHDRHAAESRGRWRMEILSLWHEVRLLDGGGDDEAEREAMELAVAQVRKLAQCSPSLSAVLT